MAEGRLTTLVGSTYASCPHFLPRSCFYQYISVLCAFSKMHTFCRSYIRHFVCEQVSISSTFFLQLLRLQVPKAPNNTADLTVFFAHSGSTCIKAVCRTGILTKGLGIPGVLILATYLLTCFSVKPQSQGFLSQLCFYKILFIFLIVRILRLSKRLKLSCQVFERGLISLKINH